MLAILAVYTAYAVATASPKACMACHEMLPRSHSWMRSAHSATVCVKCHTGPHRWYYGPAAVASRSALLARCTVRHVQGGYQDPVEARSEGTEPMADDICLQCHSVDRKTTSGFRIKIDHVEHAERNGSCMTCHVRTAHPVPTKSRALTLMSQCYTCHGTPEQPEAADDCNVCHPAAFDLKPESHETPRWKRAHGRVSALDRSQCGMCHEQQFCDDCHGVAMPHPDDWPEGDKGHAFWIKTDRESCTRCHPGGSQLCTRCHHEQYDPAKGTWLVQHKTIVRKEGTAYCMDCHEPTFCVKCHSELPAASN